MVTGDYNAPLPLSNRRSTILGSTIPFQIIATLAVILRVYARIKITKSLGWDDVIILLAMISIEIGGTCIWISTDLGMGHDFFSIPPHQLEHYLKVFYIAQGTCASSTAWIKMSLLLQYLRMPAFQTKVMKRVCWGLFALVSAWGFAMFFISWFPCFPVAAYWDWSIPNATCYGWGAKTEGPFAATFIAQEATNAVLDIIVLFLPLLLYVRRGLSRRELTAVVALSCIGLTVVALAMAHLGELVIHQAGWEPKMNLTYYAPLPTILACIEIDLAIIAASIPIFWPVLEADFQTIFVTHEVHVTSTHRRLNDSVQELEMIESNKSIEDSESGLQHAGSSGGTTGSPLYNKYKEDCDYNNAFFMEDPENMEAHGHVTHIETNAPSGGGKISLSIPRHISI